MAVARNIEDYASPRVGIFFTGSVPTLDGQCVSLVKWFLREMCDIANWSISRGDAKDFGDTLVRQGLADVVTQYKPGDIAVWKQDGGGYGHIGVVLSNNRIFEQNVSIKGSISKMISDGKTSWPVYAARIDPLKASWRKGPATFYRVRSYVENANVNKENGLMIIQNADNWFNRCNKTHLQIRGRELGRDVFQAYVGRDFLTFVEACSDDPEAELMQTYQAVGAAAVVNDWQGQISTLRDNVQNLNKRPTPEQLAELTSQIETLKNDAKVAVKEAAETQVVEAPVIAEPSLIVPVQEEVVAPVEPKITTEATKSASLFVARIASQVSAAYIIAKGLADILAQQLLIVVDASIVGWATIIIAALLVFWAQFGYQLANNAGWKWAANLKWPF